MIHQHGLFHSDIKPSNILITKPPMVIPSQTIINAGGQMGPGVNMGMSMIMMGGGQKPIVPTISGLNVSALGAPQRP